MSKDLYAIGYWAEEGNSLKLPHPIGLIDPGWHGSLGNDRDKITHYLQAGFIQSVEMGHSYCRFDTGIPDFLMGSHNLTDGIWVWPEGLWIYFRYFYIKLPDRFIDTIKSLNFMIPNDISPDIDDVDWDFELWLNWSESYYLDCSSTEPLPHPNYSYKAEH